MQPRGKLRLGARFTILLLLVLLIGAALSGLLLSRQLTNLAEDAVGTNGLLLLHTMNSVRAYTSNNVDPLVQPAMKDPNAFIPESVPAFSARSVFQQLRSSSAYKDFTYKEAATNPTLPQDKADNFETQLLVQFMQAPSTQELTGFREVNGQLLFYNARPMTVSSQNCLSCHSTPQAAPAAMVQRYGSTNGFGWQLGQVIAAQIVYVPATEVYDRARQTWLAVMAIAVASFAVAIVLVNLLLRRNVLGPIQQMAGLAQRIGAGAVAENEAEALSPVTRRADELGEMARAFQRMAHEVYIREQSLRQQLQALRIEIDEVKKAHQVAEVTDSESFRDLAARAAEMRQRRQSRSGQQPNNHVSDAGVASGDRTETRGR